jgi:3-oxoacyl-[acyl-carrier protein] reductase
MFEATLDLRGRVALVTGGGRGIGRATVERLAQAGADVVINYAHDEAAAHKTARRAEISGVRARTVRADVRYLEDAERMVSETLEHFGKLDIVVCNAGIWEGAAVEDISEELWDRVMAVNLKGTWTTCRACVPQMKARGEGRIIIVSSTAGQRGEGRVSNYAASKGGQISFMKSLATELAAYNINVNAVAPGWVETELNREVFADTSFYESVRDGIPLGRIATADDVALPILFLCSGWSRHITGEVLNVNGGAVLCG